MKSGSAAWVVFFFFQAEDGIRDYKVTGVQTCALPICGGQNGRPIRGNPRGAETCSCSQEKMAAVEFVHREWSKILGLADCRMKPILRQEQLTQVRDSKSLSKSA